MRIQVYPWEFNENRTRFIFAFFLVKSNNYPIPFNHVQSALLKPLEARKSSQIFSRISKKLQITEEVLGLNCQYTKTQQIKIPVRGKLCLHFQCFELTSFHQQNVKNIHMWRCPICNKRSVELVKD